MEHVKLPVLDDTGTHVVTYEVVEVDRQPDGTLRMLHSPAFVSGLARGDLFELDLTILEGYRILQRGGTLAAVVSFVSVDQKRDAERQLDRRVRSLGAVCEGGPGHALVFSIPAEVGFPATEAFLDGACLSFPGARWYFGNVYGADGRPLNWWVRQHR